MFGFFTNMTGKRQATFSAKQNMKAAAQRRAAGIKKAPKIKKLKAR